MRSAPGAGRQPSAPTLTSGAYKGLVLSFISVPGSDRRFHQKRLIPAFGSQGGPPSPPWPPPPPPGPPGPPALLAPSSLGARHSISRKVFPLESLIVSRARSFSSGFDFK